MYSISETISYIYPEHHHIFIFRKILVDKGLEEPLGLAVHGDFVYWVDKEFYLIERVNKFTGQERHKVQGRISHLSDIVAVNTPFLSQVSSVAGVIASSL